jgi:hypothetical protein
MKKVFQILPIWELSGVLFLMMSGNAFQCLMQFSGGQFDSVARTFNF